MAKITQQLKSISYDARSGAPPGRRVLALVLVAMLVLGSTFPGLALATEADSEGEGTAPPVEVPVDPNFDPGGEEEGLEEAPASDSEEEAGAVEVEPEVEVVTPTPEEVTGAVVNEAPTSDESAAPQPADSPPPGAPSPEAEAVPEKAPEAKGPSEPVANKAITAPKQEAETGAATSANNGTSGQAAPVGEPPPPEEPTSSPPPAASTPPRSDHGQHLAGENTYVVKSGDCLWHIAARLLPTDADTAAIEAKVAWLWNTNEARIGTGDPDLIYAGTVLIVR